MKIGSPTPSRMLQSVFTLGLMVAAFTPAMAFSLASHRALYVLEVSRLDSKSGYSNISGKLAYEIKGSSCEGYAVNYRMANRYVQAETGARLIDTQLTTWESGDGLEMNLSQKQFVDNSLESEERFNVKRPKPGDAASGAFTLPAEKDFTLPAEAVFPSSHQTKLLAAALKGETRDVTLVFDGSDGEKAYKAITFIGKKRLPGTFAADNSNAQTEPLRTLNSWPMSVSYYALDDNADAPVYQASFNMYENGISTDLTMDYGNYALKGTLTKLDLLKVEACK
jgi:EipB-like